MKLSSLFLLLSALLSAAPAITSGGIVNANGYQTVLAPGVVFVVFGSGLGPVSIAAANAPNYPTALAGTSIAFARVGGGPAVAARLVYSVATQAAGVLPSSVTPGDYSVTVTFNGEISPARTVTVVARSFGIATANSAGTGPAQVTIGNVNNGISLVRLTSGTTSFGGFVWPLSPAHPGDTLVLWGTGGGADLANDTGGTSGDQTAAGNFKVNVGGKQVTPLYAGASSGYPGLWQINFVVPGDVTLDCFVAVSVSANGELSNTVTIAVAPAGESACTTDALPSDVLSKVDAGGTLTGGGFTFVRATATNSFVLADGTRTPPVTATVETVQGGINRYSAAAVAELNSGIRIDRCIVYQKTGFQPRIGIGIPDGSLDAGLRIPVSGPRVPAAAAMDRVAGNLYSLTLPVPTLTAGTYTVAGTGGAEVASFNRAIDLPGDFNATNFNSITSIRRDQPLTIAWTGGAPGSVQINGTFWRTLSGTQENPATWRIQMATFTCTVSASQGSYIVSTAVLALLPPSGPDLTTGNFSYLSVNAVPDPRRPLFRFPLAGGGQTDWGTLHYSIGVTKNLPLLP